MRNYYIPYDEKCKKVNYLYVLSLYKLAEVDKKTYLYNRISYDTIKDLNKKLDEVNKLNEKLKYDNDRLRNQNNKNSSNSSKSSCQKNVKIVKFIDFN